jgi:hypothetical protein
MRATLLAMLVVGQVSGKAQGTTLEDGVRALVGGDYRTAATVLRPLAVGERADPAAQFLFAVLSMTGRGTDFNLGNACSLFAEAGKSTHPLAQPAMEIADSMRSNFGPGAMMLCAGGATVVPESIPASFTLGPSHTVEFMAFGVVVRFNGDERRLMQSLGPGMVPLPTRYTPLDVTRPVQTRRHFFQSFFWWPDRPDRPSLWHLVWTLNEVVAPGYFSVAGERSLVTVEGARPPDTFDVEGLVRLFVNADGDVEWTAGSGDSLRRGIAPWRGAK